MTEQMLNKQASIAQEDRYARYYDGRRSPSSGAALHDPGDVSSCCRLIECKFSGNALKPAAGIRIAAKDLRKITEEAFETGNIPAMGMSIYDPSNIRSVNGWVDLVVYYAADDSDRDCFCG